MVGGTETGRDGNGKRCDIAFPTAISRPFPPLVYIPPVYRPVARCLVPVPRVTIPLPPPFPTVSRLVAWRVVLIPFRLRTQQFLPSRISILGQLFPVQLQPDFSISRHMTIMDATDGILGNFGCNNIEEIAKLLDTTDLYTNMISHPPFFNQT